MNLKEINDVIKEFQNNSGDGKFIESTFAILSNNEIVYGKLYENVFKVNDNIYSVSEIKPINKYIIVLNEHNKYEDKPLIGVSDTIYANSIKEAKTLIIEKYNKEKSKIVIKGVYQTWQ